jgi:hypothetical protein
MAGTRKHDPQARRGWPLNGRKRSEKQANPANPAAPPSGFVSLNEAKTALQDPAPAADATALVEASTYIDSSYADPRYGGPAGGSSSAQGPEGRIYAGGLVVPVDPYATDAADPYAAADPFVIEVADPYGAYVDDTVLGGLHYRAAAPRQPVGDIQWSRALRRFAQASIWCLPAAVLTLALASVWGWPTPTSETSGASPGTWLVMSLLGLGLWLAGVVALAALVAATGLRPWGIVAVLATIAGTMFVAPVLGVIGLARPAVLRTAEVIGADPAGSLQAQFLDGAVGRWLIVCGFALLGLGAIAVAGTILGSRVLNRIDGWLVLGAVALAALAAYLSWEFLLTLAAMVMLAATLGLAWTVSRLSPDGGLAGAD